MLLILYHVFQVSGENKNVNMIEKDTAIKYLTDNGLTEDDSLGIYVTRPTKIGHVGS